MKHKLKIMGEKIEDNIATCLNESMKNHVVPSIEVNIATMQLAHTVQQSMIATLQLQKDLELMKIEKDTVDIALLSSGI